MVPHHSPGDQLRDSLPQVHRPTRSGAMVRPADEPQCFNLADESDDDSLDESEPGNGFPDESGLQLLRENGNCVGYRLREDCCGDLFDHDHRTIPGSPVSLLRSPYGEARRSYVLGLSTRTSPLVHPPGARPASVRALLAQQDRQS